MERERIRSLWQETAELPAFEPYRGTRKTDVLIIGGGITGLLCAHFLKEAGVDCVLAEADRICGGVTGNTTAKITWQHGLIYDKLLREFGPERAGMVLRANEQALEQYRQMGQEIDCDFREADSFAYSRNDRSKLDRELEALQVLGAPARFVPQLPLPFSTAGAVCAERQAMFHPLKFLAALAESLPIYEHTRILELKPGRAVAEQGSIQAEKIIVVTHFPFLNKHGSYFLKLFQHRSYVLALQNGPQLPGMYVDEAKTGLSFRMQGELLLLGGGSHRTGKQGGGWRELETFAKQHYPQARVVSRWATQDCMTLDGVPYIGQYSARTPGLYVATGYNKWGMTSAMAAAQLLTDLVQGKESPYAPAFSPSRTILRPQLAVNAWESALHLLTPTTPRCPHLGCALKYNAQEHTWDCPCHGSRFTEKGRVLDGPANGGMKRVRKNDN